MKTAKRLTSLLLLFAMLITGVPNNGLSLVRAEGESDKKVLVNANDASLVGGAVSLPFTYGESLTFGLQGAENANSLSFFYATSTGADSNLIDGNTKFTPGSYFLTYQDGEIYYDAWDFGIQIKKAKLKTPEGIALNGAVGSWNAPTESTINVPVDTDVTYSYTLHLYKDSAEIWSQSVNQNSYDFKDIIATNGYGIYTFAVSAEPATGADRYEGSDLSAVSTGYDYYDTIAPEVTAFEVGADQKLNATATDNVAVVAYAFSKSQNVADVTEWTNVEIPATSVEITSDSITAAGSYYIHVKDAKENTASSTNAILVSTVTFHSNADLLQKKLLL